MEERDTECTISLGTRGTTGEFRKIVSKKTFYACNKVIAVDLLTIFN